MKEEVLRTPKLLKNIVVIPLLKENMTQCLSWLFGIANTLSSTSRLNSYNPSGKGALSVIGIIQANIILDRIDYAVYLFNFNQYIY